MTNVHGNPALHGQIFGKATVTVDLEAGDCVVHGERPGACGPVSQSMRLHSLDEIQGAYQVQLGLSTTDPAAGDVAQALKFAATQLRNRQKEHRE